MELKEAREFVMSLSKEMKSQDSRSTNKNAYGLILLQEETILRPDGYGSELMLYWNEEEYFEWDEFIVDLKEYYDYNGEISLEDKKLIHTIEDFGDFYTLKHSTVVDKIDGMILEVDREKIACKYNANFFLTEKAYEQYAKEDGHNLNKPESYGIFMRRNKEMQDLIKAVHTLAESFEKEQSEVKKLESICEELVNLKKGVESHSWSDYKREKIC